MCGKCAIYHQCLYFSVAGAGHDGDCRAHRITYDAEMILWRALLRISDCCEEIIDFAVTECDRGTHGCAMTVIFENQNVVACFPKKCAYAEEISHTRAKSWTYQNSGCRFWIRDIIATDFVVSVKWCESNCLSG